MTFRVRRRLFLRDATVKRDVTAFSLRLGPNGAGKFAVLCVHCLQIIVSKQSSIAKVSQTIVFAEKKRPKRSKHHNAYRRAQIKGSDPFAHARCDNVSRLVRFPANWTGSYHVRSSPSVS